MSKYNALWRHIQSDGREKLRLTFAQIESIAGQPLDHSFLNFKSELSAYGYRVGKISMKNQTVDFERENQTQVSEVKMTYPKMILFDYGHTLCCEPGWDTLRGQKAVFEYVKINKSGASPEDIAEFSDSLFDGIRLAVKNGIEIHERQYQRVLYGYFGIELSISLEQAERVFWDAASPGGIMPQTDKMLDYINAQGIPCAVISNLSFSSDALRERIDRLLPNNRFEFLMTSSEYIFRKPNPLLFKLALQKVNLPAEEVWYCGDNPQADIDGAAGAGIFPVWYDNALECGYRDKSKEAAPGCAHLHIHEWSELIETLERLK